MNKPIPYSVLQDAVSALIAETCKITKKSIDHKNVKINFSELELKEGHSMIPTFYKIAIFYGDIEKFCLSGTWTETGQRIEYQK